MNEPLNENKAKPVSDVKIMGLNLLVFAIYTALCVAVSGDGGVFAFFISIVHFLVCFIVAVSVRRWSWFLVGIVIVVIGFGTCVNNFHMGRMN